MKELQLIQSALQVSKSQTNAFGKYKYRSCEDILEALKPLLEANKCHLYIEDDIVMIGDRIYVKATATIGTDEDRIGVKVSAFAREPLNKKGMDESQITGAASSYARKYALNGLFAIDDTKDADTMDNRTKKAAPKLQPKRSQVNDALLKLKTEESFMEMQVAFEKKYGNIWEEWSGNPMNKSETWTNVFSTHLNRVTGKPPVDASGTLVQETFEQMCNDCTSVSDVQAIESYLEEHKSLHCQENTDLLLGTKAEYHD